MILLIDNYDSFSHNLARYLRQLGQDTNVVRNDEISVEDVRSQLPSAIVLSPGPCAPQQAGICLELVRELHADVPMLGICLGHQAIAEALGGKVVRANEPVHGRTSLISHNDSGLFKGLPSPLRVARYHSLIVEDLPSCLQVDAELADGTAMAISHINHPIFGWQFHPESVLTSCGYQLLTAFLRAAGEPVAARKDGIEEHQGPPQSDWFRREIEYPKVN